MNNERITALVATVLLCGLLVGCVEERTPRNEEGSTGNRAAQDIEWGDDSSQWANDGECDDPRFEGPGASPIMLDEDLKHDATDCRELYEAGRIQLK